MNGRRCFFAMLGVALLLMVALILTAHPSAQAATEGEPPASPDRLAAQSVAGVGLAHAAALSTTFTYQGYLEDGGAPADGSYDFQFTLFDAASEGDPVAGPVARENVSVANGTFMAELNFGSVFTGADRWLAIRVRPGSSSGADPYTPLAPRQALRPAPYALYANGAAWSGLSGVPSGLGDGDDDTLGQLSCASGQIAEWNGSVWNCGNDDVGEGGGGGDITGVTAGTGLTGGGTSGDVTLNADTDYLQHRVSSGCAAGSSIRVINSDGTVSCETDSDSSNHTHLSQTWTGTGTGSTLLITGTFGSSGIPIIYGYPALELVNSYTGIGLGGVGLRVTSSGDGVVVHDAGRRGVYANTTNASNEWGFYTPDKVYAGTALATAGQLTFVAQNGDVTSLEPGDVVAATGVAEPLAGSSNHVPLVRRAGGDSDAGVIGVVLSGFKGEEELDEAESGIAAEFETHFTTHSASGPIAPGEYMVIVVLGMAEVKVDPATDIQAGERLTASDVAGTVRSLHTETLNGMLVTEGAPSIGVALAAPTPESDTIPVFVTLR